MRQRAWLVLSGLLMALYATYAIWGAFAKQLATPVPIKLGDIGEFWLFFLSIATFTTHVIMAERQRWREHGDIGTGAGGGQAGD
jgi:hypothetical protein